MAVEAYAPSDDITLGDGFSVTRDGLEKCVGHLPSAPHFSAAAPAQVMIAAPDGEMSRHKARGVHKHAAAPRARP